jgi:hypothetical protein
MAVPTAQHARITQQNILKRGKYDYILNARVLIKVEIAAKSLVCKGMNEIGYQTIF